MNLMIKVCLTLIIIAVAVSSINVPYPNAYILHQTGTIVLVAGLLLLTKIYSIRSISWGGATAFVLLHIIGARYIYSFVPYDEWLLALIQTNFEQLFGWQRNMYDRLVHFSFGLFLFPFIYDICKAVLKPLPHKQIILIVLLFNMSCSMLYELFEWLLAVILSPENAESYNGQQGDIWDAHKDMGLALLGCMFAIPIFSFFVGDKH